MPMRKGTSTGSKRVNIWDYVEGDYLNRYSQLHAAFVSQRLLIDDVLQISRSDIAALYLDWIRIHFDPNFHQPERRDLHNLYLHLLIGQGVNEVGEMFIGAGPRP